jgi:methyl-accepting chemotaxis protein
MSETEAEHGEEEPFMSHSLLGSLFSERRSQAPPLPLDAEALAGSRAEAEVDRGFEFALDALPCNAMFCDRELTLRYLNRASRKTLRTLQPHLPVPVDQIVGKSIHIFHKAPAKIDRIMDAMQHQGAHQLPYKATIALGPVKLDLEVEPMTDERGEFIGA